MSYATYARLCGTWHLAHGTLHIAHGICWQMASDAAHTPSQPGFTFITIADVIKIIMNVIILIIMQIIIVIRIRILLKC